MQRIWDSRILTNGGPLHEELEAALRDFLGVRHIALFSNGTTALIKALALSGEVITTPYTFVATAHALQWNGIEPVFADIDPRFLNLDPGRIEAAITPRTTAILAVHCYGTPCDTAAIKAIADRHGLRVIYDAAYAFGVTDARRHLPVVPFDLLGAHHAPGSVLLLIPLGFTAINGIRKARYEFAKSQGYNFVSYVSSRAFAWPGLDVGANCLIFDAAMVQPFIRIDTLVPDLSVPNFLASMQIRRS